jgi:hypothetical protein
MVPLGTIDLTGDVSTDMIIDTGRQGDIGSIRNGSESRDNLLWSFARSVDHLGKSAPLLAVMIEVEIFVLHHGCASATSSRSSR